MWHRWSAGPRWRIAEPSTVAQVLQDLTPMGDLSRFAIEDLLPDEEDEFFKILEDV